MKNELLIIKSAAVFSARIYPPFDSDSLPRLKQKVRGPNGTAHEKHSPLAATQFHHTTGMPKWACVFTEENTYLWCEKTI